MCVIIQINDQWQAFYAMINRLTKCVLTATSSGVYFINILRAAFISADSKSAKIVEQSVLHFWDLRVKCEWNRPLLIEVPEAIAPTVHRSCLANNEQSFEGRDVRLCYNWMESHRREPERILSEILRLKHLTQKYSFCSKGRKWAYS